MSPTSGCAFWSGLHGARLLDLLRLMLPLDLPCVMLCCLIFSKSCFATRSGLHDATLLDCLYLMLRCWTFPTVCYVSWCSLSHVMRSCHQDGTLLDLFYLMLRSWPVLLGLSSWCYAAWFPTSNYAAWPSLTDVMLLNVLTSDRVTRFGLVFMMLRCWVFSTSCLATKRMNFISIGFSTQNYSGSTSLFFVFGISSVTSCHFLVSARKKRWRGEAPKIADSVTELMVKRQQLTFIYFYLAAKACISALGMKRPARPQTFRCQANAAQHLVSLVYTLSAK